MSILCSLVHKVHIVHRSAHIYITCTYVHSWPYGGFQCTKCIQCTRVHIVHNVMHNDMRYETGAYCDNHGGSTCSDSATCLPISRRACRQLSRVWREVHGQLIFSFFVARPRLAADAESGRKLQSGPDMAQNRPRGPFWRYGACETTSRQYILCRSAPKKESATRLFPVAAFVVLKRAGTQICRRAQSPSPIQRVVWLIPNRFLVAEICPFPDFDTCPRPKCTNVHCGTPNFI